MMDRPLNVYVLCALWFEWGNPICYVFVFYALIDDCSFRSTKNNPQGGKKRIKNMRIDISKKKFIVCVMDDKEKILEETTYDSTLADAKEFAG